MRYDICVFGGCSLDMMYYADSDGRYSDQPNLLVPGGKGANQAVAASRAGARVAIITRIGKDEIGQSILDNLQYNGIFTNNVEVVDGLANDSSKIYINAHDKDNNIVRTDVAISSFTVDMVDRYKNVLLNSKMVVAQMKIAKEVSVALINFCYENNIPITITPCRPTKLKISEPGNKELIDKITYITCNEKEFETIFETDDVDNTLIKYPNKLIVTLGSRGLKYYNGEKIVNVPAHKVDVKDTTGAGDTFCGNFATFITQGFNFNDAIERAQYASNLKIQVEGAQGGMPYRADLDNYIKKCNLDDSEYDDEFDLAYSNILKAYNAVRRKKQIKVSTKDDKTFVTESDLIIEKILIEAIKEKYPDDNLVTEETNSDNKIKDRTWIIDPIDGTAHYMKNSIFFGIQLAFIDKDEIKFSIIYLPKLNEMYYAVKDKGTYLNDKRIVLNKDTEVNKCIVEFCGSMHKFYEEKSYLFNRLMNMEDRVANFMHINSCCFAFTNLIAGRTDALILSTKKPWDILPGIMLLKEAGIDGTKLNNLTIYSTSNELLKRIFNIDEKSDTVKALGSFKN